MKAHKKDHVPPTGRHVRRLKSVFISRDAKKVKVNEIECCAAAK